MSPYVLQGNEEKYNEFYKLIVENIKFAKTMSELSPNTQRMYHRKKSANLAIDDFVSNMIGYMMKKKKKYVVAESVDYKKYITSNANNIKIDKSKEHNLVSALNRKAKECGRLVFFEGAIFEATCNLKKCGVMNTQTLIMLNVPEESDIRNRRGITLYASNPGSPPPDRLYFDPAPTEETVLKDWGWKKVKIDVTQDNYHSLSGMKLFREQYPITHPGASTVSFKEHWNILVLNI